MGCQKGSRHTRCARLSRVERGTTAKRHQTSPANAAADIAARRGPAAVSRLTLTAVAASARGGKVRLRPAAMLSPGPRVGARLAGEGCGSLRPARPTWPLLAHRHPRGSPARGCPRAASRCPSRCARAARRDRPVPTPLALSAVSGASGAGPCPAAPESMPQETLSRRAAVGRPLPRGPKPPTTGGPLLWTRALW